MAPVFVAPALADDEQRPPAGVHVGPDRPGQDLGRQPAVLV